MRVALISEHASPLAALGGVDSGGQNVYVAHVAKQLTRAGHKVDVFTRLDDPALPPVVHLDRNLRVLHIPAGAGRVCTEGAPFVVHGRLRRRRF